MLTSHCSIVNELLLNDLLMFYPHCGHFRIGTAKYLINVLKNALTNALLMLTRHCSIVNDCFVNGLLLFIPHCPHFRIGTAKCLTNVLVNA